MNWQHQQCLPLLRAGLARTKDIPWRSRNDALVPPESSHLGRRCNSPQRPRSEYDLTMERLLILVLFLIVWFVILPRIPGIGRFT
jgi:hypothetical protein